VETARVVYRGFGVFLEGYNSSRGFSGITYMTDFDFIKFHGHELFVTFIACLLREERWECVASLLGESIPVKYWQPQNGPANCVFGDLSTYLRFCGPLNRERKMVSVHADILQTRYGPDKPLGQVVTFGDFEAADYFLFLRGQFEPEVDSSPRNVWRPWSSLLLNEAPRFMLDAENRSTARRVTAGLGLSNLETFRQRLSARPIVLAQLWQDAWWSPPVSPEDIRKIGTRGN